MNKVLGLTILVASTWGLMIYLSELPEWRDIPRLLLFVYGFLAFIGSYLFVGDQNE